MPPILPEIIAGARGGGRVGAGDPMLSVIEADIASQAATSLARVAGQFIGEAARYSERQTSLAQQEQQVLALQAHNKYNAAMGEWNTNYIQNAKTEDWLKYDEKYSTKQADLDKEFSANLSPFALKKYKSSNILNEQAFKTQAQNFRAKQLAANKEVQVTTTAKLAEKTAIQMNTEATMAQSIDANGKLADLQGLVYTQKGVDAYAKSAGIAIDNSKPLKEQRDTLEKEVKKLELGSNERKEKQGLLDIMTSAIGREQFIQIGIERVISGQFDGFAKENNLLSMNNLIQNSSPGGGGYEVSKPVLDKMKSVLKQREDIAKVQVAATATTAQSISEFDFRKDNVGKLDLLYNKNDREALKQFKTADAKKSYLSTSEASLSDTKRLMKSQQTADNLRVTKDLRNLDESGRNDYLKKIAPGYSEARNKKFRETASNMSTTGGTKTQDFIAQNKIEYDVLQAAKEGGMNIDGVWTTIENEDEFLNVLANQGWKAGGDSEVRRAQKAYREKDMVIADATLVSVLRSLDVDYNEFIESGGAKAVSRMLPAGRIATQKELNDAVVKYGSSQITSENIFNVDQVSDVFDELDRKQLITKPQAIQRYNAVYEQKSKDGSIPTWMSKSPDTQALSRFMADYYNFELGVGGFRDYYVLDSINPTVYIKGYGGLY